MLNKQDKKFLAALIFCQWGLLCAVISISGYFWAYHTVGLLTMGDDIKKAVEEDISDWKKEQIKKKQYKENKIKI